MNALPAARPDLSADRIRPCSRLPSYHPAPAPPNSRLVRQHGRGDLSRLLRALCVGNGRTICTVVLKKSGAGRLGSSWRQGRGTRRPIANCESRNNGRLESWQRGRLHPS